jgi:hypothetical protein
MDALFAVIALSDLLEKGILYVFGTPHYFSTFRSCSPSSLSVATNVLITIRAGEKDLRVRSTKKESFGSQFKTALPCVVGCWRALAGKPHFTVDPNLKLIISPPW